MPVNIDGAVKTYKDIDASLLKGIPNPTEKAYEIKIKVRGAKKKIIELKSLKQYVFQLRNIVASYERLINIVYDDLVAAYDPERLRVVMICNARGGISSKLTIDSDWKVRGGKESFADWRTIEDEW